MNYVYGSLNGFDYSPFVPGMKAAAAPGIVDTQPPSLSAGSPNRNAAAVALTGTASDNMAIRSVQWRTSSGASGAVPMTWVVTAGDYTSTYQWHMDWTATVPAAAGENITITAVDVKGLTKTVVVKAP